MKARIDAKMYVKRKDLDDKMEKFYELSPSFGKTISLDFFTIDMSIDTAHDTPTKLLTYKNETV